uniref:Uncharacterized protein n=1 Tax=Medicago truncatula TaxID=3880 RepID=I3SD45_MEDTR|nr:unknown [Medicago truncatula]
MDRCFVKCAKPNTNCKDRKTLSCIAGQSNEL